MYIEPYKIGLRTGTEITAFHSWAITILLALTFSSCQKEENNRNNATLGNGVLVINEGVFQFGNAKVSHFNKNTGVLQEDVFEPANGRPLGDVLQSIYCFNGKIYLVVNNSQKIEVLDTATFQSTGVISGFVSPRHFLPVNDNKGYVTDYTSNSITIVDLNSHTITGSIACSGWTEELLLSNGRVFVTNLFRNKVYVIDPVTDVLQDSIVVSYGSNSIRADKNGKVWVLCGGDKDKGFFGALHRIAPATLQVEQSLAFPQSTYKPWRLNINGTLDTLYFLNSAVYRIAISEASLPTSAFIPESNRNFYGLNIDPTENIIYLADAIDYVQRGLVYRYDNDGTIIDSFHAGIIPAGFWFE